MDAVCRGPQGRKGLMSQITLLRGQSPQSIAVGDAGAAFTNNGPDIVYYGGPTVSSASSLGAISVGSTVWLTGSPYLVLDPSAARADLTITPVSGGAGFLAGLGDVALGTPTDGQALGYQASTGKWVAASPAVAGGEIAYAENVSGTTTGVAGVANATSAAVDIPNCAITVPANSGVVWLEGQAFFQQTVAGLGQALLQIIETTGGGSTALATDSRFLPNVNATNDRNVGYLRPKYRLGSTVATRTFKLSALIAAPASNTPSVLIPNLSTFGGFASFIRAWAA